VTIERAGNYRLTLYSKSAFTSYECSVGTSKTKETFQTEQKNVSTELSLPKGDARISGTVTGGGTTRGFDHIELEFLGK
jgi:hypothetical protein